VTEPRVVPVVVPVDGPGDFAAAMAIREVVFIEEAAIPPDVERDDKDETAFHALAMLGGHAVGTGRLVRGDDVPPAETGSWGRIGRMAVLAKHRGSGIGRAILEMLEARAREQKLDGIVLHAQVHARGFYEHLGYAAYGDEFQEAGIPHIRMKKRF
jgi:predicted GNAT family N-acyltransferase